jgi:hypothetical protein
MNDLYEGILQCFVELQDRYGDHPDIDIAAECVVAEGKVRKRERVKQRQRRAMMCDTTIIDSVCSVCQKSYVVKKKVGRPQLYCSVKCGNTARKRRSRLSRSTILVEASAARASA